MCLLLIHHARQTVLLRLLRSSGPDQSQLTSDHVGIQTKNGVGFEVVNVQGVFGADHLPGANSVQDAHLICSQVRFEFFHVAVFVNSASELDALDLLEDGFTLGKISGDESVEAEIDSLLDFLLCEFALDIGGSLDD